MLPRSVELRLPDWVEEFVAAPRQLPEAEDRMSFVLDLGEEHVRRQTGGPFAAAVFTADSHELISVGVNLVVPSSTPVAHAEVVAFSMAGQARGTFDLSAAGPTELVTSTEPCAMCLGAVHWSGVSRVLISARDEDASAAGFDEGHKPVAWLQRFAEQGIDVRPDLLRPRGAALLLSYAQGGGPIYNAGIDRDA